MNIPKDGSRWTGISEVFVVLHTIELDGHTWVHYRKESSETEYSCYVESFLERFTETIN
jgi:hypothetical protein